jgi:hypothetical protein
VLVFTRTKHGANRLAQQLEGAGIRSAAIHGNKSQSARVKALADFKAGKITALVATEVASRGLDIKELPQVVNYELPNVPEDYVHRIGRTARAGATGHAVSLVAPDEASLLRDIERTMRRPVPFAATPDPAAGGLRAGAGAAATGRAARPGATQAPGTAAPRFQQAPGASRRLAQLRRPRLGPSGRLPRRTRVAKKGTGPFSAERDTTSDGTPFPEKGPGPASPFLTSPSTGVWCPCVLDDAGFARPPGGHQRSIGGRSVSGAPRGDHDSHEQARLLQVVAGGSRGCGATLRAAASLRGALLLPGEPGYEEARRVLNASINKHPALIVQPRGAADVRNAVSFARGRTCCRGEMRRAQPVRQIDLRRRHDDRPLALMRGVRVDPPRASPMSPAAACSATSITRPWPSAS